MEGSRPEKLSVRMFGGFTAEYGGKALTFGKQVNSKYGQLFQLLMTRPGKGFSKQYIMECLYGPGAVEDINASLNSTIFRLRRYLEESPLPAREYLVIREGMLMLQESVPLESDVWMFETMAERFGREKDQRKRMELCRQSWELYQGEFLPSLSNESWVIQRSRYYQRCYTHMLRYLLEQLKKERNFSRIGQLAARAAAIHPFEEWEIWQLESLASQGRQREALEFYQSMDARLHELEEGPSEEWISRFHEAGNRLEMPGGNREEILKHLTEDKIPQGAYCCGIQGFLDYFRILQRIRRRGSIGFCAMVCTIVRMGRGIGGSRESCEKQGEKLEIVFQRSLRAGDVYTKYNASQYLLLCAGAQGEDVSQIGARIDTEFQKRCGGRYRIQCQELTGK